MAEVLVKLGDDEDVFDSRILCVEDAEAEFVLEIAVERLPNGLLLEVFEELAEELDVLDAVELLEDAADEVGVFDNGAVILAGSDAVDVFDVIEERVSYRLERAVIVRNEVGVIRSVGLIVFEAVVVLVEVFDWVGESVITILSRLSCRTALSI